MTARTHKLLKDNSGVAMIYSLIIGIVVSIFAVMLLLVTYSLFAQSSRMTGQTQCRIMADTFAESFAKELMDEESDVHKYICQRYRGELEPQWIGYDRDAVSPDAFVELSYKPGDINYEIQVKLSYDAKKSIAGGDDEEDSDRLIEDDNDPDYTAGSGNDADGSGASYLSDEIIINAEITCYKGGTKGIAVQSYTVNQKCKVKMNG